MLNTKFSPWPSFTEEEANAARDVILSNKVNYWTGQETRSFEKEFAAWSGTEYAVALANGTVALDLALKALGIGAGDEVIVTSRTFLASVSSIVNAGAIPVFADVDLDSQNFTADTIRSVLTPRTKALICVHLAGWPCDMDPIMALANEHGLKVIEDCAQAHGAYYKGRPVGSIGHIGAWSFCQDKIMTTGGEGGMVTCADEALWRRMWAFKDHGKNYASVYARDHPPGFRWLHDSFGTNWRMLEMQAVIGRIQLKRMAGWHDRRASIAARYARALEPFQSLVRMPMPGSGLTHAWYRFYAYVRPDGLAPGWSRDRIVAEVVARGVPLFQGSCSEVYREKAFDNTPWRPAQRLPTAALLGDTSLMFLTHPTLSDDDVERIATTVATVLQEAAR